MHKYINTHEVNAKDSFKSCGFLLFWTVYQCIHKPLLSCLQRNAEGKKNLVIVPGIILLFLGNVWQTVMWLLHCHDFGIWKTSFYFKLSIEQQEVLEKGFHQHYVFHLPRDTWQLKPFSMLHDIWLTCAQEDLGAVYILYWC